MGDDPESGYRTDELPGADDDASRRSWKGRRALYGVTTAVLALVLGLAIADGLPGVTTYGVDTTRTSVEAGGYRLEVRYAKMSRGGLATPLEIVVHRAGGFDGPVTIGVDQRYLGLWDLNGMSPVPTSETTWGPWVLWEFDPPLGDELRFQYDARIEPSMQSGRDGAVAVVEDEEVVAELRFRTRVLP